MNSLFFWAMMILSNTGYDLPSDSIISEKNTIVKISELANHMKVIYLASLKMTVFFTKRLST
jgi:hypothetical protein